MAWTTFKDTDCGKVPDDIIYYLCKHAVTIGFRNLYDLPRGVTREYLLSECLIDAYHYNATICRPHYPIVVNIGFMKRYVIGNFWRRMHKRIDNAYIENNIDTEFKENNTKKELSYLTSSIETPLELAETKELKKVSIDIFNKWLSTEKNEQKKGAVIRYIMGEKIRDIAKDLGYKSFQRVEQIVFEAFTKLKVEAIRRSTEKEQILNKIRANYNGDIVADYIDGNATIGWFIRQLEKRLHGKVGPEAAYRILRNALNNVF